MKKGIPVLLLILLLAALLYTAQAEGGTCGTDLFWSYDGHGVLRITGTGDMTDYGSTDEDAPPWQSLGGNVVDIVIGSGVTSIGSRAFQGFGRTLYLTIPSSLEKIGEYAFDGCGQLWIVYYDGQREQAAGITIEAGNDILPGSNHWQYYSASGNCGMDLTYSISAGTVTISGTGAMDNYASNGPWNTRIFNVVIEPGVTSIGDYAFCSSDIISITIPQSVKSIGSHAFENVWRLKSIEIPNGVTTIGEYAFASSRLNSVTIGNGVKTIGDYAFSGNDLLKNITIPDGVTTIGAGAFKCDTALETVAIGAGVKSIGASAFSGCSVLETVTYGGTNADKKSIRIDGKGNTQFIMLLFGELPEAYMTCGENLKWSIDDGVLTITGTGAMDDFTFEQMNSGYSVDSPWYALRDGIRAVVVSPGVTNIGSNAFRGCYNVASIDLPESVTNIGAYAFYECRALTSIDLPESVTSIGDSAFGSCLGLTSISLPESVTSFGSSVFSWCSSLTSIALPAGVTSIGSYTFYLCSSLTSIVLPAGVTSIGIDAFDYCSSLNRVIFKGTSEERELISIDRDNDPLINATWCYLPGSGLSLPSSLKVLNADALWNTKAQRIDVPESVEVIGSGAFADCADLVALVFEGDPTSIASDAVQGCSGLTIYVHAGGTAEAWARTTGFTVVTM